MEEEISLNQIARQLDEQMRFMETKLEKPHLIGFHHSEQHIVDAMDIIDQLIGTCDDLSAEQKDISLFLLSENDEIKKSNEEIKMYINECNVELDEYECHSIENIAGYQKFVSSVEDNSANRFIEPTSIRLDSALSPLDVDEYDGNIDNISTSSPKIDTSNNIIDNESVIDLIAISPECSPSNPNIEKLILDEEETDSRNSNINIRKKLNFDSNACKDSNYKLLNSSVSKTCDKKLKLENNKNKARADHLKLALQNKENTNHVLQPSEITKSECTEGSGTSRRETVGDNINLPIGHRDDCARITFGGLKFLTIENVRDSSNSNVNNGLPNLRRETLGGKKDLLSLSGTSNLISSRRETLSDKRELPCNPVVNLRRETLTGRKNLPLGLADCSGTSRRDTLLTEQNSRRLSHYVSTKPKCQFGFGALPSPPKEPVITEFELKLIGRLK